MSAKRKTVDITLMGRSYKIACPDDEREDLMAAVALLDRKMSDIKTAGRVASAERIAVMAALNMANELRQPKNASPAAPDDVDLEAMQGRMRSMQAMLDEALAPQEKLL